MTDDLISRADAIEAIKSNVVAITPTQIDAVADCIECVEAIPSAQPKRGEWAKTFKDIGEVYPVGVYTCSCCGDYAYAPTNYCPNCGARMNSSEKPNNCEYAENPSGDVWECGCFLDTYCEHQIYDRNPDGTINIVECGYEPKDEPQTERSE